MSTSPSLTSRSNLFHYSTRDLLFLAAILLGSYLVFFHNLGVLPLEMWDESRNAVNALEMLKNGNYLVAHYEGRPEMWSTKPPLMIWSSLMSMKIFGINEFAVRFPSAVCGTLLAIYIFHFCRKYLQNPVTGFFSALVLLTSVGFIDLHVARHADYDAMLTLFVFVYCTQLYLYFEHGKNRNLYVAGIFITLAILTKGIAALMAGPGILIALLLNKHHRSAIFSVKTIAVGAGALVLALGYYFLREMYNEGYIKAVLENEITGRFGAVNEGHVGGPLFYIDNLLDKNFTAWLFFLPVAAVMNHFSNNEQLRKLNLYLAVVVNGLLLVLSSSETKIEWYDAQLYPFFAVIIGAFISTLFKVVLENQLFQKRVQPVVAALLFTALYSMPVYFMTKTTINPVHAQMHPTLLYGSYLKSFYEQHPENVKLGVYSEGYNSSLEFYKQKYNHEGRQLLVNGVFQKGDTVLTVSAGNRLKMLERYTLEPVHQDGEQYTFVVTGTDGLMAKPANDINSADAMIQYHVTNMRGNSEWFGQIREKANNNKVSVDRQLVMDAIWMLQQDSLLSDSLAKPILERYP